MPAVSFNFVNVEQMCHMQTKQDNFDGLSCAYMCAHAVIRDNVQTFLTCVKLFQAVGVLKLPLHFASAAVALLNSTDYVAVKDLLLDEDDDKLTLATTLFADDLIEMKQ